MRTITIISQNSRILFIFGVDLDYRKAHIRLTQTFVCVFPP